MANGTDYYGVALTEAERIQYAPPTPSLVGAILGFEPIPAAITNFLAPSTPGLTVGMPPLLLGPPGMAPAIGGGAILPAVKKALPYVAGAVAGLGVALDIASPGMGFIQSPGQQTIPGTGIPLGGPFAPEPPSWMIAKEWAGIGGSRFYLLINKRVVVRRRNGTWTLIKRPRMLHMKITNPRMGDVVKADKIVARVAKILRRRLK